MIYPISGSVPRISHVIVTIMFILCSSHSWAEAGREVLEEAQGVAYLQLCREEKLGVELLCNRKWKQEIDRDRAVLMVINPDPAVLLTVARSQEAVIGIEELTRETVRNMGKYADGFRIRKVMIGGSPALRVEGYSENFPETHSTDHYVVYDYRLYSFLFSVDPADKWNDYSVLLDRIIASVRFSGGQTSQDLHQDPIKE